jgi:hypothetical protein
VAAAENSWGGRSFGGSIEAGNPEQRSILPVSTPLSAGIPLSAGAPVLAGPLAGCPAGRAELHPPTASSTLATPASNAGL